MRIAVVEDNPNLCELLQVTLQRYGHQVSLFHNGSDFLTRILPQEEAPSPNPFDAVFLDLRLPGGMSGEDVLRYVRLFYPDLLVIVISAVDPGNLAFIEKKFPGVKTFSKPFHISELLATLELVES